MNEYQVSYFLWNFYHAFIITAENEKAAEKRVLGTIPETSKPGLHDLKIERYVQSWN